MEQMAVCAVTAQQRWFQRWAELCKFMQGEAETHRNVFILSEAPITQDACKWSPLVFPLIHRPLMTSLWSRLFGHMS